MNKRMVEGARRYAAANRSDPFALARALSHVANGVAGYRWQANNEREDAFYDAKQGTEDRTLPKGQVFSDGSNKHKVVVYTDVKVPT